MKGFIDKNYVWLEKWFDLKHGYGWHCHIYDCKGNACYGFSKNKFTAYRTALKELTEINIK